MHDETSPHDDALNSFEAQLRSLVPAARLDRDRLMFAAGRQVGRRRLRVVQALLAATSITCGALLALLVAVPRSPQEFPAHAGSPAPSAALAERDRGVDHVPPVVREAPTSYQLLRVLSDDLDGEIAYAPESAGMHAPDQQFAPPQNPRALLKRYLERTSDQL